MPLLRRGCLSTPAPRSPSDLSWAFSKRETRADCCKWVERERETESAKEQGGREESSPTRVPNLLRHSESGQQGVARKEGWEKLTGEKKKEKKKCEDSTLIHRPHDVVIMDQPARGFSLHLDFWKK